MQINETVSTKQSVREVLFQPREVQAPAGGHTAAAGGQVVLRLGCMWVASLCQVLEVQADPAPILEASAHKKLSFIG